MTIFITGDYHFSHRNILTYCKRPFKSVEEMNETIINNHNSLVSPEDTVIFLGDFKFYPNTVREFLDRLNGHFIFVKGNHDSSRDFKKAGIKLHKNLTIKVNDKWQYFLVHNPENAKKGNNLVAHVHEEWSFKNEKDKYMINVGVDRNDFKPHKLQTLILGDSDIFFVTIDFGDYKINFG